MSVRLHIEHHTAEAAVGATLFDCAEKLGVRVPTSCRKQGRCKECVVEITEGPHFGYALQWFTFALILFADSSAVTVQKN